MNPPDKIQQLKNAHRIGEAKEYWDGAFDTSHPDTRRHFKMLSVSDPVLHILKPETVLTIGDNRGRDAAYIKRRLKTSTVTASDLDIKHLAPVLTHGYVDELKAIDVEQINLSDNSFDVVFAKESFHHWQRPMLGLYECLRVAKKALVLIEPQDGPRSEGYRLNTYPMTGDYITEYEQIGNFKYLISVREIIKAAWSLYLPYVCVKGFNDPYHLHSDPLAYDIEEARLTKLGEQNKRFHNLVCLVIFKEPITEDDSQALSLASFRIYKQSEVKKPLP